MNYVLEKIGTVQACDVLLAGAQKKKQILERRRRNLGESIDTFRQRLDQLNQESAEVQLSLDAFATAYAALPPGKDKADVNIRLKRLELRQAVLEKKAMTYNVGALLVKELQYNALLSQVSVLDDYITEVEQRRMVLEVPTLRVAQEPILLLQPAADPVLIPSMLRLPEIRTDRFRAGLPYRFSVA